MARRHPVLLTIWSLLFTSFLVGVLVIIVFPGWEKRIGGLLIGLPFFLSMIVAVVTFLQVPRADETLARPLLYRLFVGSLLLTSLVTTVASGTTLAADSESPIGLAGLVSLGATNLVIAVLSYRALVRPHARSAARVGMIAVLLETFSIIPDIAIHTDVHPIDKTVAWTALALLAAMFSMVTGSLACVASLISFTPREALPPARVVD